MNQNSFKKSSSNNLFRILITKLCAVLLLFPRNHRFRLRTVTITFYCSLLIFTSFIVLFFSGCQQTSSTSQNQYSHQREADLEFQKGAGRPPTAKTLYAMAEILSIQGKDSECEFVLKRSINDYPKFLPAYHSLAELQMRQSRVNDAIQTLNSALKNYPRDPVTLNNLGMCYIVGKDYENALKFFTDAAGILPQRTKYRANMALALAFLGRDDEALSLYKQILPQADAEKNLQIIQSARKSLQKETEPQSEE